jgi:hypothetical protein
MNRGEKGQMAKEREKLEGFWEESKWAKRNMGGGCAFKTIKPDHPSIFTIKLLKGEIGKERSEGGAGQIAPKSPPAAADLFAHLCLLHFSAVLESLFLLLLHLLRMIVL